MKNTTENNKLVAEFMGKQPNDYLFYSFPQHGFMTLRGEFKTDFQADKLKFHSSWDWLMPVVELIKERQIFGSQRFITNINKRIMNIDILSTHSNVVDFIKYYNSKT